MNLDFKTGTFMKGDHDDHHRGSYQNVTVRRGDKWFGKKGIVPITVGGEPTNLYANIHYTSQQIFMNLDYGHLTHEHDPSCKTVAGLFKAMQVAYPDFQADEVVTVVTFYVFEGVED